MNFQYPTFLFALFTIAIPIIIHFFNFRRYKTIYFSNVDFLRNIKKQSRKKNDLKQLLILLARVLTIIFLVFAFSRPYIPSGSQKSMAAEGIIALYVDNSFSMNALSEKGRLLDEACNIAVQIAESYPPGTRFRLFTNDLYPKHRYTMFKEQLLNELTNIETSSAFIPLSLIYNSFNSEINRPDQNSNGNIFFISDFQKNITDLDNFENSSNYSYFIPLSPSRANNLYIDSCWVEVPAHGLNQQENMFIKIKNVSDEDYSNLPVKLFLNDSLKSMTNFSVTAQNEVITSLKYTNITGGIQLGKIEVTDYPFTHDNTWYFSYFVESKLRALAIYSDNSNSIEGLNYITALFTNDDYVSLETMNIQNIQISKFAGYNAIFLINLHNFSSGFLNELEEAVSNGTSVVFFPAQEKNHAHNNLFLSKFGSGLIIGTDSTKQLISGIDYENRFFANVFHDKKENAVMPEIKGHYKFNEKAVTSVNNLLWFQNGARAMSVNPYNNGKVWIFSFPLCRANESFARDIIFVPSIYNIILNSIPDQRISYTSGKDRTVLLPKSMNLSLNSMTEIENKETGNKFIPGITVTTQGHRIEIDNMIDNAGHYLIKSDNKIITSLAYNFDRKESELNYTSPEELLGKTRSVNLDNSYVINSVDKNNINILEEINKDKHLWKFCIIATLIFILAEVLITRFMR